MKTQFLFPNRFRIIGWILFLPCLVMTIVIPAFSIPIDNYLIVRVFAVYEDGDYFKFSRNSIVDELLLFGLITGGILIGFSRLKEEDELISKIRYESLVWATYFNYGLILLFTLFIYGFGYLDVLFYNTFTLILFFIVRFHYKLYQLKKAGDEE